MRHYKLVPTAMLGLYLVGGGLLSAASIAASPWEWEGVARVVAIGDVHGSYDKLLQLLQGTGLVDDQLKWVGEKDHLVFVGDMVDRGPDDRPVLDLVRRLQKEAEAAGGRVHSLLGNHEVMNLSGDLRYVSEKGFSDFLAEEDRRDRNQAMQGFRRAVAPGSTLTEIRTAFEERFPPGYFGRLNAFWYDGEYGSWLLEQPAVVKINGTVFLHGGLTKEVAALGLEAINRQVRDSVLGFMENGEKLVQITGAPPSYLDAMTVAYDLGKRPRDRSDRAAVARTVLQLSESLPYVPSGPLWYRGVSVENERIERINVEQSLGSLDARAMVIAHTPTRSGVITSRFGGRVYRVDVGMAYGRQPQALVIEDDSFLVFDPASRAYVAAAGEHPSGEVWSRFQEQLPDAQLERFLLEASVTQSQCTRIQRGVRFGDVCELEGEHLQLRAVFQTVDEKPGQVAEEPLTVPRSYRHEIASYLLDRMLGTDMVPVTVERTIDGRTGSLQIWLESAVDLTLLEIYDQEDLLSGLTEEVITADILMAFMGVYEQAAFGQMLLPQEKRIVLADITKAFSTSADIPPELLTPPCSPEPDEQLFLRAVSHQELEQLVGKYLTSQQIDALLARRDMILERCSGAVDEAAKPAG